MALFKSRNILLMIIVIAICVSAASSWRRRRRRRRCDTSACQYKWGTCSKPCGGGIQKPIVTKPKGACGKCNLPKPRKCNTKCCRVNCAVGYWGKWGRCSKICGRGTRIRKRIVTRYPKCGGSKCPSTTKSEYCNTKCCPVYCRWSSWNPHGKCSATCGGGKQIRIRKILRKASCGAPPCAQSGAAFFQEHSCNKNCCPIDCQWKKWKAWESCSKSCGGGIKNRHRSIQRKAACGGKHCEGHPYESDICNNYECPSNEGGCPDLGCSKHSKCVSTSDGPDCVCKKGFIGDGFECTKLY